MGFLNTRKLASPQYRSPRRNKVTGAIAVHTAESVLDSIGPDTGAENVADWMTRRTDPGSYHDLVDSDSIVNLVDYGDEAFHDGTGGNRWSLGLSFACRTTDWAGMSDKQRRGFITNGAKAAARMAAYVKAETGVVVPAKRITAAQYRAGQPGFVSHAELDPGRRSDPGNKAGQFPWDDFLAEFATQYAALTGGKPPSHQPKDLLDMDQKELEKIVNDAVNRAIGQTWLLGSEAEKDYGSLRGWIVAVAQKLGVTRDEAIANDPTHKAKKS